jgi:signal transduction histidine kinase
MLGGMSGAEYRGRPGVRFGPLAAEVSAFAVLAVVDTVVSARAGWAWAGVPQSTGLSAAVLVLLRRRFPDGLGALAAGVLALAAVSAVVPHLLSTMAVLAAAVAIGAGCRRLAGGPAIAVTAAGGAVMVGAGRDTAVLAVSAAVLWGVAVALGLILRDADARRAAGAVEARTAERLRIARELHDVVTHHVTGIVVRAQAARLLAVRSRSGTRPPDDDDGYAEIEDAAKAALTSMRRLVRMLRDDDRRSLERQDLARSLRAAIDDDPRVSLAIDDDGVALPAPVVATAYWLALESLTNVRRHAPGATTIGVDARLERSAFDPALLLTIVNDGAPEAAKGDGFGLIGMAERVRDAGGTLRIGPAGDGRWQVAARLPLDGGASTASQGA